MMFKKFVHEHVGAGAIAWTIRVPEAIWNIACVTAELSAAPTTAQDFTIDLDSEEGANFDARLFTQDLNGEVGMLWSPSGKRPVAGATGNARKSGDELEIAFPNGDGRDVGIIVWLERIGSR